MTTTMLVIKKKAAHSPFIIVGPHVHSQTANFRWLEEGERWLGCCHLHGHILILYISRRGDQKKKGDPSKTAVCRAREPSEAPRL